MLAVFNQIAMAESHVHGIPVTDIHFHEVGTIDAISDVVAVSLLFSMIKPDEVIASPVATGYGHVETMHGVLPVPAPATLEILSGIPIYQGDVEGELCTPTGAALLKHFVKKFTQMPLMSVGKIGYGMGTKDFPKANLLRAILGEREVESDEVSGLFANVDDMTGEEIGFALEMLFEEGALDVYTTGIGMKKSRPGVMISVICEEKDEERLVRALFKYTSTLGIRKSVFSRHTLHRSEDVVDTKYGKVRIKRSSGYGVERRKSGYDDVAAIARRENLSICPLWKADMFCLRKYVYTCDENY